MPQRLMIHTIQPGDLLTMIGPDRETSEPFVLAEVPRLADRWAWIYREYDSPIVVDRRYALDATFDLHHRLPKDQTTTRSTFRHV